MIGMRWRPDRPDDRPTPVVNLAEPVVITPPELPEPVIGPRIIRDHETLALAALDMSPLAAYWMAHRLFGPGYATSWSTWVAEHRRIAGLEGWLRWQDENE